MESDEWIGLGEPERWNLALEGVPHGYWHRWSACMAASRSAGLPAFLYVAHIEEGKVVCPLLQREWKGLRDFTTPIGFSGFASSTGVLPESFPARWAAAMESMRAVCAYIALHPIHAPDWPAGGEVSERTLFVLGLEDSPQDWLRGVDENRRRDIRAWEKSGREWLRNRGLLTEFLVANHAEFMRSVGASAASFHNEDALRVLCADPQVELVGIADCDGICTAAAFGSTPWGCELVFHISIRDGRRYTSALMWWAIQHYHGACSSLNLGGTAKEDDAVAMAKRRYRPRELPFRTLRQVFDRPAYQRLCVEAGVDAQDPSGYFPSYRRSAAWSAARYS